MITLKLNIESDCYRPVQGAQCIELKSNFIAEEEFLKSIFLIASRYSSLSAEQVGIINNIAKQKA